MSSAKNQGGAERSSGALDPRKLYRAFFEEAPDAMLATDPHGRFIVVNRRGTALTGYSREELLGMAITDVINSEDLARDPISMDDLRAGEIVTKERNILRKDGSLLPVEIRTRMQPEGNLLVIVRDITERKWAEAEQAALLEIAGAFGRVGQEIMSSLSNRGLLNRLCQVTTEVMGCDRSGTSLWDAREEAFVPVASYGDSPEQWEIVRLLRLRRSALATQIEAMERDGIFKMKIADLPDSGPKAAACACGVTASMMVPLYRGSELVGFHTADYCGREGVLGERDARIARGIGQLASLALESVRLIEELERANRLKSDFVATMSHELRTPLNNILGYSDLLLDGGFGPMTEDQVHTLQRIGKSAEGLLKMITATLDLSSLDTGQVQLDVQAIDLPDLVRELDAEISGLRENPNVNFAWDVAPELPELRSDPAKLKVVLKNLISNAIKFTHAGSVVVRLRARDGGVEITVADTGVGIAGEMLPVIFDPFCQVEPAMTHQHPGVGLGLYIVRRAIDVLGGTIEAESIVGQGSTFCVWVPSQVV